jgi:hypothetical protein
LASAGAGQIIGAKKTDQHGQILDQTDSSLVLNAEVPQSHRRVPRQLRRAPLVLDGALLENVDALGGGERELRVLLNKEHRSPWRGISRMVSPIVSTKAGIRRSVGISC